MTHQTNTDSNDWLEHRFLEDGEDDGLWLGGHPLIINGYGVFGDDAKNLLTHISKHYIPKEEVDEMVRLAKCSHNNTTHRSTSGGGYYSDCYDCGARLMPWSLVENAQLSTNKKGSE